MNLDLTRGLWLPPSHVIHGTPPRFRCNLCPAVFWSRGQYERHCTDPKIHDEQEIARLSPRLQAPGLFDPDAGDAEWGRWIAENAAAGNDPERYMKTDAGKSTSGLGDG